MPQNWKTYKFSELFDVSSGLSKSRDQFGFGSPFLTFKDVFYNYFLPDTLGDLANTNEKEQLKGSVKRGDVFLTRTSETLHELGMSSVALKDYPEATFNGFSKRLRLKKDIEVQIDPVFLGYYLRSQRFRHEVSAHASMTTRASLNNSSIGSLRVKLPPIEEQENIGQILKPLDDKIELNLQTNRTLEEMAMALYKHWFVDFGPFQNGNFIDSELGSIPEGWVVKTVGDISKVNSNSIKKRKEPELIEYIDIASVNEGWVSEVQPMLYADAPSRARRILNEGDIVWSTVRPNRKSRFLSLGFRDNTIVSTGFAVISPIQVPFSFLYPHTCTDDFTDYLVSRATGSSYPAVTGGVFEDAKLIVPANANLKEYDKLVKPLYQQFAENNLENQTLTTLRDTLLPKLISGEVRVKEAAQTVANAI